jgi:hypothetical protein
VCTFSVLPPMVMRYCRFYWPCLLAVYRCLSMGLSRYHLARHLWRIGWAVIARAAALKDRLISWVQEQYRELSDGKSIRQLEYMVKYMVGKLGRVEVVRRWYRHRYPRRFFYKKVFHTIRL